MSRVKTGGRQIGTPNKSTQDLLDICKKYDQTPFEALLDIAMGEEHETGTRMFALKEICSYLYPKRKALELSTDDEKGFKIILEDYTSKK